MKEIILTPKRQKRELLTLLVCLAIAFCLNIYAVVAYKSPAWEIVTSLGYVVVFAAVLYALWTGLRLIAWGLRRLITRKKTK